MTTKATIQRYFDALQLKQGWESFLADVTNGKIDSFAIYFDTAPYPG